MIFDTLACIGLMFILKYGTILQWYRNFVSKLHPKLEELHKCSLCLGFWCGVAVMAFEFYFNCYNYKYLLLPLISAGVCWFVDNVNNTIQSVEIKLDKELDL